MFDAEFGPAVRAVRDAATGVLIVRNDAEVEMLTALTKHLKAIECFDKLTIEGGLKRAALVSAAHAWLDNPSDVDRKAFASIIRNEASWFADLY